jgi:uroporphyrinogen decarboxylase
VGDPAQGRKRWHNRSGPAAFIIDSPWLPNWYGVRILDYFSSDDIWFKANLKAIESFPK